MKLLRFISTVFFWLFILQQSKAYSPEIQDTIKPLIQFSGVVITGDSLNPIPFAGIRIEGTHYGMMADYEGYFSFAARPGSTILFTAIGFKPSRYHIPDSLKLHRYTWIQMLQTDTILLKETIIFPWANVAQLEQAIVEYRVPDGDYERAMKNILKEEMKERALQLPMDGAMNYRQQVQNLVYKNYYNGQFRPNNLLNPLAWQKFIEAWKNGDFKRKDEN